MTARSAIVEIPDALGQTGNFSVDTDIEDIVGEESVYLRSTMKISNPSGAYLYGHLYLETSPSSPAGASDQRIGVGNVVNTNDWGINGNGGDTVNPVNYSSGVDVVIDTPTTMVLKLNQITGEWSFWLNPDLSQPEPAEPTLSGINPRIIDGIGYIRFRGGRYGNIPVNTNLTDFTDVALFTGDDSPFNVPATRFQLRIEGNSSTSGHHDFEWDSRDGKVYDLVSATDLDTAPDSWPVWQGLTNLGATPPTNILTDIAGGGDPRRFFAVLEKDAPPLLSESFDGAAALPAGWTTNGPVSGTTWDVGTPSGVASGPAAAHSPDYCAGTNVTGYYTGNTDVSLVSPVLAVPSGSGATLKYWQFIDTALIGTPHDLGSVRILDADNADTPVAGLGITGIGGDGTAGWTEQTLTLPEGGVGGKNIKVEFRFVSNPGDVPDTDVWSGFYIDDVLVTVP